MLKWVRGIDWLPLISVALFYVLAVELMSSFGFQQYNKDNHGQYQTDKERTESAGPWGATEWTALFTAVLTGSTIGLWYVTYRIAYDADESSKTLISMERPYVTGGGDFENEWGKELFRLDVENHGKTAAFMTGYDLQFAKLADLQTEYPKVRPVRENQFRHIDGISPQGARKEIRTQRQKSGDDDVVFGAVYYRDIFDRPHHSRFILRIAPWREIPGEGLTRLDVKGVSTEYWSWDIPKNEQA
jgi:hypothetical protein